MRQRIEAKTLSPAGQLREVTAFAPADDATACIVTEAGALVIKDLIRTDKRHLIFAPGQWVSVEVVEEQS